MNVFPGREKPTLRAQVRHMAYAAGWKKFETLWDWIIRSRRLMHALPVLEAVLSSTGRSEARTTRRVDDAPTTVPAARTASDPASS